MDVHIRLGIVGQTGHGKTALKAAMSSSNCRSSNSKHRVSAVDFEFLKIVLPSGNKIDAVDLPSFESSLGWMATGVLGLDIAIVAVACDEGVTPRTREYIEILELLGVPSGLVALTKSDLIGREALGGLRRDVESLVCGTFMSDAPIVPVSIMANRGLSEILHAVDNVLVSPKLRDRTGAFFMPIDKVSSVRVGAVVAGASYRGVVKEGSDVELMPYGRLSRASSIWAQGVRVGSSPLGGRIEIGLDFVTPEQIRRGDILCEKGRFARTECLEVSLDVLPRAIEPIAHLQRVRLLINSFDVVARVSVLSNEGYCVEPGHSSVAQLLPESRIITSSGERFVILSNSPISVVGGGRVLIPCAKRPHSKEERAVHESLLEELAANWSPKSMLSVMLRERECVDEDELLRMSQMESSEFHRLIAELKEDQSISGVESLGASVGFLLSRSAVSRLTQNVLSSVNSFHKLRPELAGPDIEDIQSDLYGEYDASRPESLVFREFLQTLLMKGIIKQTEVAAGVRYHLPDFKPHCDDTMSDIVEKLRAAIDNAGFELIETIALPSILGAKPVEAARALGYLRENDCIEIIGEGLLIPKNIMKRAFEAIISIKGEISSAALARKLGISRKASSAILIFFDSQGVTKLTGDRRVIQRISR
ncbi:MAG: SelB C-terminal domain-containing protein [Synergistaceae bacterium]|nr:SelB C-terminal domain-containing protein [Synergistaceae bacterium]